MVKTWKSIKSIVSVQRQGNSKVRKTMINSLPAGLTCHKENKKYCIHTCYGNRYEKLRRSCHMAYMKNYNAYLQNPDLYFDCLDSAIKKDLPEFFRFDASGDFPSQDYVDRVTALVKNNPNTKFLAYTKQVDFDYSNLARLKNMSLYFSIFPNMPIPENTLNLPLAYMKDKKGIETRIPKKAFECGKKGDTCDTCRYCWTVKKAVYFNQH